MNSCLSKAGRPTGFSGTGEGMLSPGGWWGSRQVESFGVGADFFLLICFASLSKVCFRLALFVQYFCSVSCWGTCFTCWTPTRTPETLHPDGSTWRRKYLKREFLPKCPSQTIFKKLIVWEAHEKLPPLTSVQQSSFLWPRGEAVVRISEMKRIHTRKSTIQLLYVEIFCTIQNCFEPTRAIVGPWGLLPALVAAGGRLLEPANLQTFGDDNDRWRQWGNSWYIDGDKIC